MIKRFQVNDGFMSGLPAFAGNRLFEFTPGFNVLFGENGSGKSCAVKSMAAHCSIETGGWSTIQEPAKLAYDRPSHFPYCYRAFTPGKSNVLVDWDGTPTFYYDAELLGKNDMTWFWSSEKASLDGITSEAEQMDIMATKPSSGQYRIHKINKIMKIIKNPPDLSVIPDHIANKDLAQMERNYLMSLPKTGKVTLLFDEPEKALALPMQLELFNVMNTLSEHFQVIVVTHSPFILFQKGINIIDMKPGFAKVCKDLIKKTVGGNKK